MVVALPYLSNPDVQQLFSWMWPVLAAAGKKKTLNVGRSGGSAGLEDYQFDDLLDDDGFM